jgi:lysophospholipase L1-like esterase
MRLEENGDQNFSQIIHAARPDYFPAQQCGGIGGWSTWDAVNYIDIWINDFPGRYVGLSYGTNDSGWMAGSQDDLNQFYGYFETLVKAVINAGKIPVIPTIPWKADDPDGAKVGLFNNQLSLLKQDYPQIISGPDLWTYFHDHQDQIDDGIHPTSEGYVAYRRLWAETMLAAVYP